ncbi:MAG: hypothetical protein NTV34_04140 [Proteobacteria bacterium]|nr:hypothetical protein [Pseudomonadota bacterium]
MFLKKSTMCKRMLAAAACLWLSACNLRHKNPANELGGPTSKVEPRANEGLYIRNGVDDTEANDRKVFGVYNMDNKWLQGSAFAAFRDRRCLITAAHVAGVSGRLKVLQGQELTANSKYQLVKARAFRPSQPPPRQVSFYSDVGLIWLTDLKSPNHIADYTKFEIAQSAILPDYQVFPHKEGIPPTANLGIEGTIIGYGLNFAEQGTYVNSLTGGTDGKRRIASTLITHYSEGKLMTLLPRPGSLYLSQRTSMDAVVDGRDSGGPLLGANGEAVGVIVAGLRNDKPPEPWRIGSAGLNKYEADGENSSNYEYLLKQSDLVCTKSISVILDEGILDVHGVFDRPRTYLDSALNNKIDCREDQSDCSENVHEGMSGTLVATAKPGYKFLRWDQRAIDVAEPNMKVCPCNGSTSLVCHFTYDDLGYYSATGSADGVNCAAVAEKVYSNPMGDGYPGAIGP